MIFDIFYNCTNSIYAKITKGIAISNNPIYLKLFLKRKNISCFYLEIRRSVI